MPPTIRPATPNDAAALERLYREVAPRLRVPPTVSFAQASRGETVWVAESVADGSLGHPGIVGLLSAWPPGSFVHHLYVTAAWRRRGLGRRLLAEAQPDMARPWRLKCLSDNLEALAFYHRLGWRVCGHGTGAAGPHIELEGPH